MGQTSTSSDESLGMVGSSPKKIKADRKKVSSQPTDPEEIARTEAEKNNLPYVNLADFKINPKTLTLLPVEIARQLQAVPYLTINNQVRVAFSQPDKLNQILERLADYLSAKKYRPLMVITSQNSLDQALEQYKSATKKTSDSKKTQTEFKKPGGKLKTLSTEISQVPTTKLLNTILAGAVENRASDIHLVPQESYARVRFRIDGVLQDVSQIPLPSYKKVLSRIKFHAKIRLNVAKKPQDGRFATDIGGKKIDIRVSSFPSIDGEALVLRLLEERKEFYKMNELGFSKEIMSKIGKAITKPNGMILNTGPTGSGKTTTLYAVIDYLNKPEVKIITLEDPIEYHLDGVAQTQIDPEHDFTFSNSLKYALRQDPDIIMVGEIRDKETATTALHSSLTGHLLLSTFHTNNAASTFIRLLDMGIRPFLLIGSINIVIAQRLVRQLCKKCKQEHAPTKNEVETIKHLADDETLKIGKIYQKKGCPKCNMTGYWGRTAIAEALIPTKKLERVILNKPTESQIEEIAKKDGMKTISQDGVEKLLAGTTSLKELLRVVAE